MKYFIIAGEASGDLHAGNLIKALRREDPSAAFVGLGGDRMREEGCHLYQDYRRMAFMGFVAVLKNLDKVRENFRIAREALVKEQPDVLILVDYPSFNLKMAEYCRKHLPNTRIVYYIPPKCWAWKQWRVHKIAQLSDLILGIFPFEPAFYAKFGYRCEYVGNPTAGSMAQAHISDTWSIEKCDATIAILPGSRQSEISHCLPRMIEAAERIEGYDIVVTMAPGIEDEFYHKIAATMRKSDTSRIRYTRDTYNIVAHARVAIVNSGTATLETAIIGTPQVAVYHLEPARLIAILRPHLQKYIFPLPYFTLVNIVPDMPVIQELLGEDFSIDTVEKETRRLIDDAPYCEKMLQGYAHIRHLLGTQDAARTAAQRVVMIASNK